MPINLRLVLFTEHDIVDVDVAALRVIGGRNDDGKPVEQVVPEFPGGSHAAPSALPATAVGAKDREVNRLLVPLAVSNQHAPEPVAVPAAAIPGLGAVFPVEDKVSTVKVGIINTIKERHGPNTACSIVHRKVPWRTPAAFLLV